MEKKRRKIKFRWKRILPYFLLALFLLVGLRLAIGFSQPAHRPSSVTVAIKDMTQNVSADPRPKSPPSPRIEPNDLKSNGPLLIETLSEEMLSPIKPGLRVTVKDLATPPEVAPAEKVEDEDEGDSIAITPPYEEKLATPETPVPPTPKGQAQGKPRIAIIIDDVGLKASDMQSLLPLPAAVTLSFLPYASRVQDQVDRARTAGHEVMLHLPMQPIGHDNPGPDALLTKLSEKENLERLEKALNSFKGFDGVNNHMGSAFTSDAALMTPVLHKIADKGFFFIDSRTSGQSAAGKIMAEMKMSHASRDVFLDNEQKASSIQAQLAKVEKVARARGYAIAIGHPHAETLQELRIWVKDLPARGFELVPAHDLVNK